MSFLLRLIFFVIKVYFIFGYPMYKVYICSKENRIEKLWIFYFLILGALTLLESTIFFPLIWIFNKICPSFIYIIKVMICLWLYHPNYLGSLFIEENFGNYLDSIYIKINKIIGNLINYIGISNRDSIGVLKKKN